MREGDRQPDVLSSYIRPQQRVPANHPLRPNREMVDAVLRELSSEFAGLYPKLGRHSIPPEKLLRALVHQALYTIRSERQVMEQLDYSLLFRWFLGLSLDDPIWGATVFTKNHDWLLHGDIGRAFFERVVAQAQAGKLLSAEHFTVDGTLIEVWASLKSFHHKDMSTSPPGDPGNPTVNFHGRAPLNPTHASTTDPEARLARQARVQEAQLAYQGHVLMENRNGLSVDTCVTQAGGLAQRKTAEAMAINLPAGATSALTGATTPPTSSPPCGSSRSRSPVGCRAWDGCSPPPWPWTTWFMSRT